MVLSDKRILEALEQGRVIIEPFSRDNLSTSSYDVCIGEHFYREQTPLFDHGVYNMYDPEHVARVWGPLHTAELATEVLVDSPYHGFRSDDRVILLAPGETILAHTQEFIGGRRDVTTMMKARSSLGRSFVLVCKCAGWGDVGYLNRWTMEVTNCSQRWYIPLPVGERVAQIVFMDTGETLGEEYGADGAGSSYQSSTEVREIMRSWNPSDMLPRPRRRGA